MKATLAVLFAIGMIVAAVGWFVQGQDIPGARWFEVYVIFAVSSILIRMESP